MKRKSKFFKSLSQIALALAVCTMPVLSVAKPANTVSAYTTADASNHVAVSELYNNGFSATNVQTLLDKIAGHQNATFAEIDSAIDKNDSSTFIKSSTISSRNSDDDLYVVFGGYTWAVTYVSKDTRDNLIATLWLANSSQLGESAKTSTWSSGWWSSEVGNEVNNMPSNMYGTSYIRSKLVGSQFAEAYDAENSVDRENWTNIALTTGNTGSNNQIEALKVFTTGALAEYIVEPQYVSWQQTQHTHDTTQMDMGEGNVVSMMSDLPNESWGTVADSYYNFFDQDAGEVVNNVQFNYSSKADNDAWKTDKLWLPSLHETGSIDEIPEGFPDSLLTFAKGIWGLNNSQRANASGNDETYEDFSWLRSGDYNYAADASDLRASGANSYSSNVVITYAVRPSLHLNLKSAAEAAGLTSSEDPEETGIAIDLAVLSITCGIIVISMAYVVITTKQKKLLVK